MAEIGRGGITLNAPPRPLSEVEHAWVEPEAAAERIVLVPWRDALEVVGQRAERPNRTVASGAL